jgi:hypothetical protein
MGLPSHCFFKGFKIPFWKKPTTADHYKDPNPELDFFAGLRMFLAVSFFFSSLPEDQVCQNTGSNGMFEAVGLAVLSCLGCH